jgi:hypothetical protein
LVADKGVVDREDDDNYHDDVEGVRRHASTDVATDASFV